MVATATHPAFSERSLQDAKALVGVWLRRPPQATIASRDVVNAWTRCIGDRNKLFLDPGYGNESSVGSMVAHPCWLYAVDTTVVDPKLAGLHTIYAGTDWEFYRWVRVGETIRSRARLIDVQKKEGRFAGPMILQVGEVIYWDQMGQPVARAISRVFRYDREAARQRNIYKDLGTYRYATDELFALEDVYDAEQVRGAQPRFWEDVKEGEELQTVAKGPLTSEEMLHFVSNTRPVDAFWLFAEKRKRHPAIAFRDPDYGHWETWEAGMLLAPVAQMEGYPAAHDAGIDRISWLACVPTNWMGDDGFLRKLNVALRLPCFFGDLIYSKGRVVRKYREGEDALVECRVWCENQRKAVIAEGTAVIALPLKAAKPHAALPRKGRG